MGDNVRVCLRVRPQNAKEKEMSEEPCLAFPTKQKVTVLSNDMSFEFDRCFNLETTQVEVFEFGARPIVDAVLQGFNGTVFAYGQTSSGKTFTMEGVIDSPELQGIMPRMVWTVFDGIYHADEHVEFLVKVSLVEIYQERVRDLLDPLKDNLKIHEDKARGVFLGDVTESYVQSEQEIFDAIRLGNVNRTVAATQMNAVSSRSHLVFILTVEQKNLSDRSVKSGKLYLVDLAGSEKVSKTNVAGQTLEEAKQINRSLSALGNVIMALVDGKAHIPYRDSKLTRMLQESLGGNAKTALIVTASPSKYNEAETISTLRFGQRAKMITNKAKVNEEKSAEELKILLDKSQSKNAKLILRIAQLEELLTANNIEIPEFDKTAALAAAKDIPDKKESFDAEEQDKEEIQELREEVRDKNLQIQELARKLEAAEIGGGGGKGDLFEADKDKLAYEIDELTTTIEKLKGESSVHQIEMEAQKAESKLFKDKFDELEAKKNEVSGDPTDAATKSVLAQLRSSQDTKMSVQKELDSLREQCTALLTQVADGPVPQTDKIEYIQFVKDTTDKIAKLQETLIEEGQRNNDLQEKLKDGDRPLKRKVSQLDKNLEQLTVMYHKLVSQNSGLKVESQVNEKKIQRKEQRIQQLERNLREAKNKYEKLLTQCANLTAAMDVMGRARGDREGGSTKGSHAKNIKKPLRGGDRPSPASKTRDPEPDESAQED